MISKQDVCCGRLKHFFESLGLWVFLLVKETFLKNRSCSCALPALGGSAGAPARRCTSESLDSSLTFISTLLSAITSFFNSYEYESYAAVSD